MYKRVNPMDIIGQKFGRLTVMEYDGFYDMTGTGRKKHWRFAGLR